MARDRASRPEAKPLRLFVATLVPEDVRVAVADAVAPIRERYPKARWVPTENQHVTVKFLGRTWPRLLEWVAASVSEVAAGHGPFETRIDGLGAFPNVRRARVLWAGLEDAGARFSAIAGALDDALARAFEPEKRAFTPHLTIARFDPTAGLEALEAAFESEPFEIDRIVLFRSHLRRPAPVYERLAIFPLGMSGQTSTR
ncbi:MAG: RNA 2',3'-cyclic phosphodiesterase [Actinobacteria bacterium]|nr:RNA 2',3'-cyclic phosphodiesterase [Actinomycetota bacterium]